MSQKERDQDSWIGMSVLVGANLIPLVGVLLWDWSLFGLLVLYWSESAIVGLFSIIDIPRRFGLSFGAVFTMLFFLVHFSIFMVGHLMFLIALVQMTGVEITGGLVQSLWRAITVEMSQMTFAIGFGALIISHGYEWVTASPESQEMSEKAMGRVMKKPYHRIAAMHISIIVLLFLISLMGTQVTGTLLVIILVKLLVDLWSSGIELPFP